MGDLDAQGVDTTRIFLADPLGAQLDWANCCGWQSLAKELYTIFSVFVGGFHSSQN